MADAAAGDQEDLLVVESRESAFQCRRGEDALVAGLQERVTLGVDRLQRQFTDLVAREGALNLFLAHIDGIARLVITITGCVLEDVREDTIRGAPHPRMLVYRLVSERMSQPGQCARDAGGEQGLAVDLVDRLGEGRVNQRGTHHLQELAALLL